MEFSFLGTCARLQVAHWSAGAYSYFEVGHLRSLLAFSPVVVVTVGPSTLLRLLCSSLSPKSSLYRCPIPSQATSSHLPLLCFIFFLPEKKITVWIFVAYLFMVDF